MTRTDLARAATNWAYNMRMAARTAQRSGAPWMQEATLEAAEATDQARRVKKALRK